MSVSRIESRFKAAKVALTAHRHTASSTCSHIMRSYREKNEQFTHQKVSSTALVNFAWSPGNLPSRTGPETPRGRAHATAPRFFLPSSCCRVIFSYFFQYLVFSGPESVSGSPQAAAELWGGKHCGSVTSGHFHKLFFFFPAGTVYCFFQPSESVGPILSERRIHLQANLHMDFMNKHM